MSDDGIDLEGLDLSKLRLHTVVVIRPNGDLIGGGFLQDRKDESPEHLRSLTSIFHYCSRDEDIRRLQGIMGAALFQSKSQRCLFHSIAGEVLICSVKWMSEASMFMIATYHLPAKPPGVSDKQATLLRALCEDRQVSDIARMLDVEVSTVQSHLSKLRHKLGLQTTYGLVAWWLTSFPEHNGMPLPPGTSITDPAQSEA